MRWKVLLSVTLIFFVTIASGCSGNSRAAKVGWKVYKEARGDVLRGILETVFTSDGEWIQDRLRGVYIWNPEPVDGESMEWFGNVVSEDGKLYAQGKGGIVWYINGRDVQIDEGYFEHGKQQGKFRHTLPDNRVFYTEWDNGKRIK